MSLIERARAYTAGQGASREPWGRLVLELATALEEAAAREERYRERIAELEAKVRFLRDDDRYGEPEWTFDLPPAIPTEPSVEEAR